MSPFDLTLSLLVIAVPGLGATLAAYPPGKISLPLRLALTFGFGYAMAGAVAFVLTAAGFLEPAPLLGILGAGTVVLWVIGLRRGSLREHGKAIVTEVKAEPWSLGGGLLIIVAIAAFRLTLSPFLNFHGSAPWRYWADAMEIADAGTIPDASLQYGAVFPPTVSKAFLNSFNAGLSFVIGRDALPALGSILWVGSVGFVVSLWAVGRELGFRFTALLLPLWVTLNGLFLNSELTTDLSTYKAEITGRMVAFAGLALALRTLRERDGWKGPVLAGLVFAAAAGTHLVPLIVSLAILVFYGLARFLLDGEFWKLVRRGAVMAGIAGVIGLSFPVLVGGDIGFQGARVRTRDVYRELFGGRFDPTEYLGTGVVNQFTRFYPGGWYERPSRLYEQFVASSTGIAPEPAGDPGVPLFVVILVPAGGLILALVILTWFPKDVRHAGVVALGLGGVLLLGTLFFAFRYDTYVPALFGVRRLLDYSSIPIILLMLAVLEVGIRALRRVEVGTAAVIGLVVAGLMAAALLPSSKPNEQIVDTGRRAVPALQWVRDNTPCDARILPSRRTAATFMAVTGRVSITEGMAPYLRPEILLKSTRILLASRKFFQDPAAHERFVRRQGIDYVVLFTGSGLGNEVLFGDIATEEFPTVPFLDLEFEYEDAEIYRVTGTAQTGKDFPNPGDFPGYRCERGPIPGT